MLERFNDTMLQYDDTLRNEISPQYRSLASTAGTGLKQALMKTDLSESVQDSQVMAIHPTGSVQIDGVVVDFFVQVRNNAPSLFIPKSNCVVGADERTARRRRAQRKTDEVAGEHQLHFRRQ